MLSAKKWHGRSFTQAVTFKKKPNKQKKGLRKKKKCITTNSSRLFYALFRALDNGTRDPELQSLVRL